MSPAERGLADSGSVRDAIRALRIELGILNDRVALAAGLNPRDLDVLDVIDREGPCTPGHLAERTGARRATLTGVLARLEADGWIARERDVADGRSARLRSTARFDELRALYAGADTRADRMVRELPTEVCEALPDVLRRLADGAREAARDLV